MTLMYRVFVEEVLDLMQRRRDLRDRHAFLVQRISDVKPWGDLDFPPKEELAHNRLWFYRLPLKNRDALQAVDLPWAILEDDHRFLYVTLIAPEEPPADILPGSSNPRRLTADAQVEGRAGRHGDRSGSG